MTVARNVTDVDEVLLAEARRRGESYSMLATLERARFEATMATLRVRMPDHSPTAAQAVGHVVQLASALLARDRAYLRGGTVYARTAAAAAGPDRDTALRLAAEFHDHPDDPAKDDPLDVAVWQETADDVASWPSPWGQGRPGWHAECAAMVLALFGSGVDIHCGGADLAYPHHACEAALAEGATGVAPFARAWMRAGVVGVDGVKMAKSTGNLVLIEDLLRRSLGRRGPAAVPEPAVGAAVGLPRRGSRPGRDAGRAAVRGLGPPGRAGGRPGCRTRRSARRPRRARGAGDRAGGRRPGRPHADRDPRLELISGAGGCRPELAHLESRRNGRGGMRLRAVRVWCVVATAVAGAMATVATPAAALRANLLADPGFETAGSGWTPDSWGTNDAALDLVPDAHSGAAAARVTITSYADGDAKWLPDPVAVTPDTTYTYDDWYRASAATELWAQFATSTGALSYLHLAGVAAATTWTATGVAVAVPASAVSVRVFHVLAGVGTLLVDDVALTADTACAPATVNGVPNGSFEDACPPSAAGVPAGWTADGTGSYGDTGATPDGAHAVTVQNGVDGAEAGLTTTLPGLAPGQRYRLSFLQSGDTFVYAYLTITHAAGGVTTQSLPSAPATDGAWSQYSDAFVTPADTRSVTVTIATSGVGTIALDSVTLTALANQVPATFAAGTVSLTFDDGDASVYTNGWPAMRSYGYRGTFYLNAATLNSTGFLTSAQVRALATAGNEIGSHLYHHSDLVQLDSATLADELSGNAAALHRIVGANTPVTAFASPFGSYTSGALDTVMRYASSHRTSDGAMNTKADLDPRTIHAKLVTSAMTAAALGALVQQAKASHSWLVLVYHNIAAAGSSQPAGEAGYTVTPAAFKAQLAAVARTGVAVRPLTSALTTLSGQ